ncbi:MAG: 30S ribosomal protein S2 [Myxococcales bacterium]|nr:30S ribosomal protein S2 [Myxococcales bacterium]
MAESTGTPEPEVAGAAPAAPAPAAPATEEAQGPAELSLRGLLEVGAHFGHQTRRWDPRMKNFIYGDRDGIHILNLDQTLERFEEGLDFIRETVAQGGKVLFVATKRQAQEAVKAQAERSGQYYVNNRWLGGMLTNFRTVKKSIERFKEQLVLLEDEEKVAELSKKELSRINRSVTKYQKSLDGIREMQKLPDVIFMIDINREHIGLAECRRLGIPIVAIVDTNCSPDGIDFVVPGNDDAIRAIEYYTQLVADAAVAGANLFNERVQAEAVEEAKGRASEPAGRRVVEIKPPTRARRGPGGTHTAAEPKGPQNPRKRVEEAPAAEAAPGAAEASAAPAAADAAAAPAEAEAPAEASAAPEAPAAEAAAEAAPKTEGGGEG